MHYAAAKSLQLCPTLGDPIDGNPPGSPVPGILQARTLEWVAISFSNAGKWKVKVKSLSRVWLFTTPRTAAHQAPPSMGFSRQEYWSGVPLPSPKRTINMKILLMLTLITWLRQSSFSTINLLCFSPFLNLTLWQEDAMYSSHLRSGDLRSTFLKGSIFLNYWEFCMTRFVYSPTIYNVCGCVHRFTVGIIKFCKPIAYIIMFLNKPINNTLQTSDSLIMILFQARKMKGIKFKLSGSLQC